MPRDEGAYLSDVISDFGAGANNGTDKGHIK